MMTKLSMYPTIYLNTFFTDGGGLLFHLIQLQFSWPPRSQAASLRGRLEGLIHLHYLDKAEQEKSDTAD